MVEVMVLDTGEYVLGTAGEVHLETCIKDLQERFARIKLLVRIVEMVPSRPFASLTT